MQKNFVLCAYFLRFIFHRKISKISNFWSGDQNIFWVGKLREQVALPRDSVLSAFVTFEWDVKEDATLQCMCIEEHAKTILLMKLLSINSSNFDMVNST